MADPTRGLADLADTGIRRATPVEYEESAAAATARYGHSLVAVVDLEDRFLGFVPPGRILQALADEHEEDVARFGGCLARSTQVGWRSRSGSRCGSGTARPGLSSSLAKPWRPQC